AGLLPHHEEGERVERAGRGGGKTGDHSGDLGDGRNDGPGGQVGGQGSDVNDGVNGVPDFSTIIAQQLGCTYKEFLAYNPKEYEGKGGAKVYTHWIEKMESVHDMSGCRDSQRVKYSVGSFVGKALTWWNSEIRTRGREAAVGMSRCSLKANSLIKRVYMLSLRERMELDLEARLMGETLVLNRSLDPFLEDYIELNDLNEPFELRRNQGDDLMPTIEEGEVIEEFRTRDEDLDTEIDDYPSYCDDDKKIHIDCAHNLKFSCMIGFEFTHVNFFPLLYVNVMSKKFHNSIMKDKMVYKGNNVVGALMNVPIFVGTFSVVTDFAVLEDMDAYRDEGMGDVIVGEPFLREVGIKAKRFDGMITIYNGNDEVTYQMVRSHPRFKNHTNEQCNKIPPLLKVSEKDEKNGISHAYQKLKGFYKGVLNLGPDYIRNAKTEEWLTRGHVSVHEME
ncbi:hypothetical protein Tco_1487152, partial [Tanacetum coccineum]